MLDELNKNIIYMCLYYEWFSNPFPCLLCKGDFADSHWIKYPLYFSMLDGLSTIYTLLFLI